MTLVEKLEAFIFDVDVQKNISAITNNFMDLNIFEVTGMGSQEIKHSNVLAWLLDRREHDFEHQILEKFLTKVGDLAKDDQLLHYVFLPKYKRSIEIFREKNGIDLLIVDNVNHVVIAIENKVFANERTEGEDGGQLNKYEEYVNKNFSDFKMFFIYLTPDLSDASTDNWINASYEMLVSCLHEILDTNEVLPKIRLIVKSYIDLLKRRGIVADKQLKALCEKIWADQNYREALEVLYEYKPSNYEVISKILLDELNGIGAVSEYYAGKNNDIIFRTQCINKNLYDDNELFYNLTFGYDGVFLALYIPKEDTKLDKYYQKLFPEKAKKNQRYYRNQLIAIRDKKWDRYVNDVSINDLYTEIIEDIKKVFNCLSITDQKLSSLLRKK
ncbi:PD-(D/E)XK nuclease family protein [Sulfurovum sp.]|uniref:PDDEXK-like family protein n=1 Tax=Sulfurovum sp. TaxID=1969726 RepID=UPI003564697E